MKRQENLEERGGFAVSSPKDTTQSPLIWRMDLRTPNEEGQVWQRTGRRGSVEIDDSSKSRGLLHSAGFQVALLSGFGGGEMTGKQPSEELSSVRNADVEDLVEMLLNRPGPKKDRVALMKELFRRGDDLPDEVLAEAMKRLVNRVLHD
jgi:hypothetical protein